MFALLHILVAAASPTFLLPSTLDISKSGAAAAHSGAAMVISDEIQFRQTLTVFGHTHAADYGSDWVVRNLRNLRTAGICSVSDLGQGCKDGTVNLDLELFGIPAPEKLSERTLAQLSAFLPGPVGFRCFRLAQKCAQKVRNGTADVKYVHRPESGKIGDEQWDIPVNDDWTMHVDCAGFVRNILKYATKDPFRLSLSDRDFMRAKDFFRFFQTVPYTVLDETDIPENQQKMKWRIVKDLRMVLPGDIITYRPNGNAAGNAAFTTNDRIDMYHMLKAVKTAELWHEEEGEWKSLVTRNLAKDPVVKEWVQRTRKRLEAIGIKTVREFRTHANSINSLLEEHGEKPLAERTLQLMKECSTTTALNTGHIVFASGPAVAVGNNEYRIPVIHSTKFGKPDKDGNATEGIQDHFRRFTMIERSDGRISWTREMAQCPVVDDDDDDVMEDPFDDMNPEDTDDDDEVVVAAADSAESGDELEGQLDVEVLAARMCF